MIGGYGQAWAIEINGQMNLLPRIHIQSEGAVRTEEILQSSKATGSKLSLNGAVFVETDSQLNTDTLTFDYVSNSGQISNWNFTVGSTPVTTTTGKTINLPNLKNINFIAKSTIFRSLAYNSGTGSFVNPKDGKILFEGDNYVWSTLANGGTATVRNSGGGTLSFNDGAVNCAACFGGKLILTNSKGGTINIGGRTNPSSSTLNGIQFLVDGKDSVGLLENAGTLNILGSSNVDAISFWASNGGQLTLSNLQGGIVNIQGNSIQGASTVVHGSSSIAKFDNSGTLNILGGAGGYTIVYGAIDGGQFLLSNSQAGTVNIEGGSGGSGISYGASNRGKFILSNSQASTVNIKGATSSSASSSSSARGISVVASGAGSIAKFDNSGTLNILGGAGGYGITYGASGGGQFILSNSQAGTVIIEGGTNSSAHGISVVTSGVGSVAKFENSGTLKILGGSGRYGGYRGFGIAYGATVGGQFTLKNLVGGTVYVEGGDGSSSDGIFSIAQGKTSVGRIDNEGVLNIIGSANANSYGIEYGAYYGGKFILSNSKTGTVNIEGGGTSLTDGISNVAYGAEAVGQIDNAGTLNLLGGSWQNGIRIAAEKGGHVTLNNLESGIFNIKGGSSAETHGIGYIVDGQSSVVQIHNAGMLNILGGSTGSGITTGASAGGQLTLTNSKGGTFYLLGTKNQKGIETIANGTSATANFFNHAGAVFNVNRNGLGRLSNNGGQFNFVNEGAVNADAEVFFESYDRIVETQSPLDIIIFTPESETTKTVQLDSYKLTNTSYVPDWRIRQDWLDPGVSVTWTDGGTLTITNIADGTEDASKIREIFEAKYGTGTMLSFTGTSRYESAQTDVRTQTYPDFTLSHVNELIARGDLVENGIVTSETLTHKDAALTIGAEGDLKQNIGFKGIRGSTGITVKDGKTLTLMGSQAPIAMAVGADTRDTNYVITDAPMTLTNGNLNLGHANLSATEGKLAAVTYDNQSTVNINNGIFTFESLKGNGAVTVAETSRATVTGDFQTANATNSGTLTVNGKTTLSRNAVTGASTYAVNRNGFTNQKGTANFNGGLEIGKGTSLTNMAGAVVNAGAITMNELGTINAVKGSTINATSFDQNGIMRMLGTLNITGAMTVGDNSNTTLGGESTIGTLTVGRTTPTKLASGTGFFASPMGAQLRLTGKHYVDELDFVSGTVSVDDGATLTGKTLKDGEIGSTITVANGGTFGFSHNKSSLDRALEGYVGDKVDKAILALNTDLHFANGGSLTVGTVADARGTVNLGSDSLLLLGTTDLHGEALLNGTSVQQLHVEDGATIAMTDDLMWGNHYILKGFDKPSSDEVMNVGVKDKDGKAMTLNRNDQGLFVTIGSDNILDKDKSFRLVNQMNWLLDGHQNTKAEQGDVAFLTNALLAKNGAEATNRMEALASDAGVMAETQRMTAQVQTTMLDHATSARKGHGTFWVDGVFADVDSGDYERTAGASSYDVDTTGFVFGSDLPVADDYRLGVAFSAQRGDLDGQHGLSSDIEGYGLSVYGGYTFASGLNVSGSLSYVDTVHEVSAFNLGAVKANVDATAWMLGGRASMPYAFNRMWVTPYVGFDVMKVNQDAFSASWSGKEAFNYAETDATILRTPVGVKAGTFVPLEMFGRSGTLNWDADLAFIPQFGDTEADYHVSGVSNGHSDAYEGTFANDWLSTLKLGMSWQGAAGAFGIRYGVEKGDVRNLSHSVKAKASLYF